VAAPWRPSRPCRMITALPHSELKGPGCGWAAACDVSVGGPDAVGTRSPSPVVDPPGPPAAIPSDGDPLLGLCRWLLGLLHGSSQSGGPFRQRPQER
jgi:hypothetical protein